MTKEQEIAFCKECEASGMDVFEVAKALQAKREELKDDLTQ